MLFFEPALPCLESFFEILVASTSKFNYFAFSECRLRFLVDSYFIQILHEQYTNAEDRGRRSFYSLVTVTVVLGFMLYRYDPSINIEMLGVKIDADFVLLIGPLALAMVFMSFHYTSAYTCITLGRFSQAVSESSEQLAQLGARDIGLLAKRRSVHGNSNLYRMDWNIRSLSHPNIPRVLSVAGELFWILSTFIYNFMPIAVYAWGVKALYFSSIEHPVRIGFSMFYCVLGLGLIGAPVFLFLFVKNLKIDGFLLSAFERP